MPLLRNADKDKSKISKRKHPVSINYYRDIGILPEALLNFLGTMGWSFGGDREKFTLREMIDVFSWDRVSLGGPVFNLDKLTWLNEKYLHELSIEELADRAIAWRLNKDYLMTVLPLVQKRIRKLDELVPATEFFFSGDLDLQPVSRELAVPDVAPADVAKALLGLRRAVRGPGRLDQADAGGRGHRVVRRARLEDQARVHAAAGRGHRPHRHPAAVRDHGGARQGDHAAPAAPRRRGRRQGRR